MEIKRATKFSAALVIAFLLLAACSQSAGVDSSAPAQGTDPSTPEGTVPESQNPDIGSDDGGPTDPDTTPPVVTWTVSYDGNDPAGGTVPVAQEVVDGESVTVAPNSGALSKTGYAFSGWNTKADGTGIDYLEGIATIAPTADIVLFARWLSTAPVATSGCIQWKDGSTVSPVKNVSIYARTYNPAERTYEVRLIILTGSDPSCWIEVPASENRAGYPVAGDGKANKEYVAVIDSHVVAPLAGGNYSYAFKIREQGSPWFYTSADSLTPLQASLNPSDIHNSITVTK